MNDLSADAFKALENIFDPDARYKYFVVYDEKEKKDRKITLNDFYVKISELELNNVVPKDVRLQFDTVRNLLLYSWYVYGFGVVAELQAYATLEFALREKAKKTLDLKNNKIGFQKLLKLALKHDWITDEDIRHNKRIEERRRYHLTGTKEPFDELYGSESRDTQEYCKILIKSFPKLRNFLAHGSPSLWPPFNSLLTLELCTDLISQLFQNDADKTCTS